MHKFSIYEGKRVASFQTRSRSRESRVNLLSDYWVRISIKIYIQT